MFRIPFFDHWRHPVSMTKAEHDRQRDLVRASELRSTDVTERHALYARRPVLRMGGGFRTGQVTPPRPTEPPR